MVLVGFMGSGKSHVGTLLARRLGLPFVDADALVETEAGPIEDIFAARGEAGFREVERRVVLDALAGLAARPAVLALGGGAVQDGDVRAALRAAASGAVPGDAGPAGAALRAAAPRVPALFVAWLDAPVEVLWERVRRAERRAERRGRRRRPLARDEAAFRELYGRREPWYQEVASARFRNDGGRSPEEVADWVAEEVADRVAEEVADGAGEGIAGWASEGVAGGMGAHAPGSA